MASMSNLEKQLAKHEGLRLKPYLDTVGKLTIGYGRNLDDNGITDREALIMMRHDIEVAQNELLQFMWFRELCDVRQDALIDMHFNLGLPRLLSFRKMIAALSEKDFERAASEALDSRWAGQVGQRARTIAEQIRTGSAETY